MDTKKQYRIKVNPYMTRKSTAGFDFMEKFNGNCPMPDTVMTGTLLCDRGKLVQMRLVSDKGVPWSGWIITSAILKAVDITEPVRQTVRVVVSGGKTVVELGGDLEVKERALFLMERFDCKGADGGCLYFPALDFEDICFELEHLGVPTQQSHGNYLEAFRIPEELPVTELAAPVPQELTRTKLYPYQAEGIAYGLRHRCFLLGDDMGLGKTIQALLTAAGKKEMYGFRHCLIICGVNSVKYNWVKEIEKHTNLHGVVLADGTAEKMKQLQSLGRACYSEEALDAMGKRDRKKAEAVNALNRAYFLVVNMEAFRNDAFTEQVRELCRNGQIGGILFDEIHKCVNTESRQSKNILTLPAQFKIGITGTPLVNRPTDAYFTFAWLEKTKMNVWQWSTVYRRKTGQYTYEDRNLGLLRQNFDNIMLRRRKEDVLDLPDKVYTEELVEMNEEQERLYQTVEETVSRDENSPALPKIIRLRQVTGIPGVAASATGCTAYLNVSSAKMERLAERVQELIEQRQKVVIFSNWVETLNALERYGITNILRIDGNVSPEQRTKIEELWQSEAEGGRIEHPVLAGTIDAMGTGYNLQSATNVIFVDEPWTNAKKEQAVDRCYRVGTKSTVNVITLLCRNTVDEDVHDVVMGKKTMAELLVGYGSTAGGTECLEGETEFSESTVQSSGEEAQVSENTPGFSGGESPEHVLEDYEIEALLRY